MLRALLPILLATVLAAGLGAGANRLSSASPAPRTVEAPAQREKPADAHAKPGKPETSPDKHSKAAAPATISGVLPLPPIVGPLRAPSQIWVRFEGSIVVEDVDTIRAKALTLEIADDTLVYFATVSLSEIEGVIGLKAVREDLTERARIRGEGKLRDVLIQTLVTQ